MFPHVLIVLSIVIGEAPAPIATFVYESNCKTIASLLNASFIKNAIEKKAVCVHAVKEGEI